MGSSTHLLLVLSDLSINMYSALYRYFQENVPQNRNKLKNPLIFIYFFVKQKAQHPRKKRNEGKPNKASSDQKVPCWNVLYSYPWTGNVWSASHGLWKVRKWLCLENIFSEWFQMDVSHQKTCAYSVFSSWIFFVWKERSGETMHKGYKSTSTTTFYECVWVIACWTLSLDRSSGIMWF